MRPFLEAGSRVRASDIAAGAALQLRLLAVPDAGEEGADRSRVQGEARVRAQDRQVREEGAEEAVEAAQVPEEVGEGPRRRVHEPQDAAQVPDVVRRLRLTGRKQGVIQVQVGRRSRLPLAQEQEVQRR